MASIKTAFQAAEITPPRFATPMTSVLAPASRAWAKVISAMPRSALQPSIRYWATAFSGRQSLMPCATFAANWSGASPKNKRYGVCIMSGLIHYQREIYLAFSRNYFYFFLIYRIIQNFIRIIMIIFDRYTKKFCLMLDIG